MTSPSWAGDRRCQRNQANHARTSWWPTTSKHVARLLLNAPRSINRCDLCKVIHWAKFYMSKAGLVASPKRGRFITTEAGRALLASNPARIGVNDLKDYDGFRGFYSGQKSTDDDAAPAAIVQSAETG